MIQRIERQFAGRTLSLEFGRMAKLAHGSCLVQYGDTVILCTATAQDKSTHLPFFPLTVEYREKSYAAGQTRRARLNTPRPTPPGILGN